MRDKLSCWSGDGCCHRQHSYWDSGGYSHSGIEAKRPWKSRSPRGSCFGRSKRLNLLKGLIECVRELQSVAFVKDQRWTNFQHVGVRAVDSHEHS